MFELRDDTHMTSVKIVQLSVPPTLLSINVQNSSTLLTLDVQFQTNPFLRVATEFLWMTSLTFALSIVFFPWLKPWQLHIFSLTYSEKHSFFPDFLGWSTCPNLTSPYSLAKDNFKWQWFDKRDCCNILNNLLKKLFTTIKVKIKSNKTKQY